MRCLALIAVLAVSSAAAAVSPADADQAAAERLEARAQDALDRIVGPGRSKVEVDVLGERSEVNTDTEILLPMSRGPAGKERQEAHTLDLPGYGKDKPPPSKEKEPAGAEPFQRQREARLRDAGFQIRSVHAVVVFDSALDSDTVRAASQALPPILGLDTTRGDTLSFLDAPLRPAWKSAFTTPADWRAAAYALGIAALALLVALIASGGFIGAGRALGGSLGRELARARAERDAAAGAAEALPELSPGAAGFLEAGAAGGAAEAEGAPLLGRRFDFLIGKDPDLVLRAVMAEKPEDLPLFFGHLAESIPDLASRLFAHLPPDVQGEVSQSLLKLAVADPERLGDLEERLRRALDGGIMGPRSLGKMLSRVPGGTRAELLDLLTERDARGAEEVRSHVFSFEDLEGIELSSLRRLLGSVPFDTWGPALRGAPPALVQAVLGDLPDGPRDVVRAAVELPQPRGKVEEARAKVLDAYLALVAKGDIRAGRARKDEDLV